MCVGDSGGRPRLVSWRMVLREVSGRGYAAQADGGSGWFFFNDSLLVVVKDLLICGGERNNL